MNPRVLVALLVAAAIAVAGFVLRTRAASAKPEQPTFTLLLFGGTQAVDSASRAVRAAEFARWTDAIGAEGLVISGGLLRSGGMVMSKPDTNPFSGVSLEVVRDPGDREVVGSYLVRASSVQEALAMARDCPHLRYGGHIIVRQGVEP